MTTPACPRQDHNTPKQDHIQPPGQDHTAPREDHIHPLDRITPIPPAPPQTGSHLPLPRQDHPHPPSLRITPAPLRDRIIPAPWTGSHPPPPTYGHYSLCAGGRYASYWNGFLFMRNSRTEVSYQLGYKNAGEAYQSGYLGHICRIGGKRIQGVLKGGGRVLGML